MQVKPQKNYLSNKSLLEEIGKSKAQGRMTDELAKKLMLLTERYARKPNFGGYSFNEDMQAYALLMLCKTWDSFDETKYDNPFAFYTQCIKNSFIQFLNAEKKQRNVRDVMMMDVGLNPSFNYTEDGQKKGQGDFSDEQDFDSISRQFNALQTPDVTDDIDQAPEQVDTDHVPDQVVASSE